MAEKNIFAYKPFLSLNISDLIYFLCDTIVCTPSTLSAGGRRGGWTSYQIFKKGGGAWQDFNLYGGVAGKEGVTFFLGWEGLIFT